MAHFPQAQTRVRSPRVSVPNAEPVTFNFDNHAVSATLHKISVTGGLVEFSQKPPRSNFAEIRLTTASGPVSALVEFLRSPKPDSLRRAFRFVALSDDDYKKLARAIKAMHQLGLGE